jgi:starch-binding outer membrane protein, SusD/RagB family
MKTKILIKYISVICLITVLFSSCQDFLDLKPKDSIVYEEYWQTKSQLEAAVAGCYRSAIEDGVISRMIQWGELRTDEITAGGSRSGDEKNVMDMNITPTNAICNWSDFYKVINNCNTVLDNGKLVMDHDPTLSTTELKAYEAEALALRSLMYFYLVRTYKEVPLVLVGSKIASQNYDVEKTSEDVILTQIISDLNIAAQNAVVSYDNDQYDKGRFTKSGIYALLADVCLWAKQYPACTEACNKVMENKNLLLVQDEGYGYWNDYLFYKGNSNESIFELQFSANGKNSTQIFNEYGSASNASPHLQVPCNSSIWNISSIFDLADIRSSAFSIAASTTSGYIRKYISDSRNSVKSSSNSTNWIVYRLADVYLMKAEPLVQDNFDANKESAMALVNKIYLRAHPSLDAADSLQINDYASKDKMDQLILEQRQKEFMFEGKRWFDLLRTSRRATDPMAVFRTYILQNIDVNYRSLAEIKLQSDWSRYLPISKSDMESNLKLVQNPFYDTTTY